jgi:hypothetical protein
MKVFLAVCTLVAVASCASGGRSTAVSAPAGQLEGTYDFVATIPSQVIRGTIRVEGDTMYFVPEKDCLSSIRSEPLGRAGTAGVFRYSCNGAILEFDRRNPTRSSKWSANVAVQRLREICAERAVRNGREVCIRTEMERFEVQEPRSGSIQVMRRP